MYTVHTHTHYAYTVSLFSLSIVVLCVNGQKAIDTLPCLALPRRHATPHPIELQCSAAAVLFIHLEGLMQCIIISNDILMKSKRGNASANRLDSTRHRQVIKRSIIQGAPQSRVTTSGRVRRCCCCCCCCCLSAQQKSVIQCFAS